MRYTIPRELLAAVALAASTEDTRYYLQGVFVEIGLKSVTLTATNGHILLTARHAPNNANNDPASPIIIPSATIALALKDKATTIDLFIDGNAFKLGNISFTPIDGTFPDYRRVIPKAVPETRSIEGVWFNSLYLATMAKAAKLIGAPSSPYGGNGYNIYPDKGNAALVRFNGAENIVGVVMPLRAPVSGFTLPDWVHNNPE